MNMHTYKTSSTVYPGNRTIPTRYSPVGGNGPILGVDEGCREEVEVETDVIVEIGVEVDDEYLVVFAVLVVFEVFNVLDVFVVLDSTGCQ